MFGQMQAGFAEGKRTIIAFAFIGIGVACGVLGAIVGMTRRAAE
jgi:hypothetical protein